jgi:hypothetical protein
VSGTEKPFKVHAESVEELQTEVQTKLKNKHPQVAIVLPLRFTTASPGCAARPLVETDKQVWALSNDTLVWLLPPVSIEVRVTMPGQLEPIVCVAHSLDSLQDALRRQQPNLSDGVFFTVASASAAVTSWDEVKSLSEPVVLFAAWHWCAVPLKLQLIVNPQLDAANGTCAICSRPLAHHAHLTLS